MSDYVKDVYLTKPQCSAMAKFRCGVAPICLETGRYEVLSVPEQERICNNCDLNEIENEVHVITRCPMYNDIREDLYLKTSSNCEDFNDLSDNEKFVFIMSNAEIIKYSAKACQAILYRRRFNLFNPD